MNTETDPAVETLVFRLVVGAYNLARRASPDNESKLAERALRSLEGSAVLTAVTAETSLCTFERRKYGRQFYCWARHPVFGSIGDPWPALNWPKAALAVAVSQAALNHFGQGATP